MTTHTHTQYRQLRQKCWLQRTKNLCVTHTERIFPDFGLTKITLYWTFGSHSRARWVLGIGLTAIFNDNCWPFDLLGKNTWTNPMVSCTPHNITNPPTAKVFTAFYNSSVDSRAEWCEDFFPMKNSPKMEAIFVGPMLFDNKMRHT